LAAYCNEIGNYWECEARRKDLQVSPLEKVGLFDRAQKHLKHARDLAIQFGFTPASRTRINIPKQKERSELDDL